MATEGQYLDRCRQNLGKREQPMGSNHVPGVTDQPGFWDDSWCAMNASVCCRDVGIPLWTASVAGVIERAQSGRDGWSWGSTPRLGALPCFDFPGGGHTDHVGSGIEAIRSDGQLVVIEGNHQDQCMRVVRDPDTYVIGYAYPPFSDQPTEEDQDVAFTDEYREHLDKMLAKFETALMDPEYGILKRLEVGEYNDTATNEAVGRLEVSIRDQNSGIEAKVDEILKKLDG